VKHRFVWLVTLPIALASVEGGHAVANTVFGAPNGSAAELFGDPGSRAALLLPLVAVALGFVLAGLAARASGMWWASRRSHAVALPFAWLPPLAFFLLELVEGTLQSGAMPWSDLATPAFLFGLALQLPFALGGYLLARALLRLSDVVRELVLRRRRPRRRTAAALPPRPTDVAPPARASRSEHLGRGPPRALPAPS
jgi:hypothetical protein